MGHFLPLRPIHGIENHMLLFLPLVRIALEEIFTTYQPCFHIIVRFGFENPRWLRMVFSIIWGSLPTGFPKGVIIFQAFLFSCFSSLWPALFLTFFLGLHVCSFSSRCLFLFL